MINLTTLPYPMFSTSPEEKEILRKCELYYIENCSGNDKCWRGLCEVIYAVVGETFSSRVLLHKISKSISPRLYLPGVFRFNDDDFSNWYYQQDDSDPFYHYSRNILRRIWITKLLAYEGE